jgi:hypothetical protein
MKSFIQFSILILFSLLFINVNASWSIKTEVYASDDCKEGTSIYSKTRSNLYYDECFSMVPEYDFLPDNINPFIEGLKCYLGPCTVFSNRTCVMDICKITCDSYNFTNCDGIPDFQYDYNSLNKTCVMVSESLSYSFTFHGISVCIPPIPDPHCHNGIEGFGSATYDICCTKSCGICGGTGCSLRPGGAKDCCAENILNSGIPCSLASAPCLMAKPTPTPDPYCHHGIIGYGPNHSELCCTKSCGKCGGTGCSLRPGGAKDCCTGNILDSKVLCKTSSAPCIVHT